MAEHSMSTRTVIPSPCHGQACGEETKDDNCKWTQYHPVSSITTWWFDLCWCRLEWRMGTKTAVDAKRRNYLMEVYSDVSSGGKYDTVSIYQ